MKSIMQSMSVLLLLTVAACSEPVEPTLVADSDDFRAAKPVAGITATNLGVLPGDNQSVAFGVNNFGQVVGQSANGNTGVVRAFLWQSGAMTDITPSGYESASYAISNASPAKAVGFRWAAGGSNQAIRWTLTSPATIDVLETDASNAYGINDAGAVVGTVCSPCAGASPLWYGAIWNPPDSRVLIEPLAGYTNAFASDINNAGYVVGASYGVAGGTDTYRGYIRLPGGSLVELAPLPGHSSSDAFALSEPNADGEIFVAGRSRTGTSESSAVRWTVSSAGAVIATQDVATSGWADGAHNAGHVAGTTLGRKQYAFLWRNGQLQKLPAVKRSSASAARGMNRGDALGGGTIYVAGESRVSTWPHATLWTITE